MLLFRTLYIIHMTVEVWQLTLVDCVSIFTLQVCSSLVTYRVHTIQKAKLSTKSLSQTRQNTVAEKGKLLRSTVINQLMFQINSN